LLGGRAGKVQQSERSEVVVMRFPEVLQKLEQLESDFAYVLDVLVHSHAISEPDADVFREIINDHTIQGTLSPPRDRDAPPAPAPTD
jgi:hypothetical protein